MDRFAQTSSLRSRSEITKPYFAAPVKQSDSHYLVVCFRDDAEIVFLRQPREKVPWSLVREPLGKRASVAVVVERAQFSDRATQHLGCRLGVFRFSFAHGNHFLRTRYGSGVSYAPSNDDEVTLNVIKRRHLW